MREVYATGVAAIAILLTPPTILLTPPAIVTPPPLPHVMVIVEENRSESAVIGSGDAPFINALASRYGMAAQSYGQSHPSLPNYLALISGSTQGVSDDGTGYVFSGPTLANQLSDHGIDWRAYMEDLPSPCYGGSGAGGYAKKHDPFMYFSSITGTAALCNRVVAFTQFGSDLNAGRLAPFVWITPNLCNDGHDCSNGTMDTWLQSNLSPVLASAWFAQHGVVIVTWDEGSDGSGCCSGAHGGHIATIVVSHDLTEPARSDAAIDHAGVLRTVEQIFGLPYLGDAACMCSGNLDALLATPPTVIDGFTWLSAPHLR
jgi:phospholipase C